MGEEFRNIKWLIVVRKSGTTVENLNTLDLAGTQRNRHLRNDDRMDAAAAAAAAAESRSRRCTRAPPTSSLIPGKEGATCVTTSSRQQLKNWAPFWSQAELNAWILDSFQKERIKRDNLFQVGDREAFLAATRRCCSPSGVFCP